MKRKIFKLIGKVIKGTLDTTLPNIEKSTKNTEFDPVQNKQVTKIDWVRLVASAITFLILVLNLFGQIDLVNFIKNLINELSSTLLK
jgi:large-conductance mechanosensitive channel